MLKPLPGFALIELPAKYESGLQTEKEKYATHSEGILRQAVYVIGENDRMTPEDYEESYGKSKDKTVYFANFADGEIIKHENKEYVFVPVKELRGVKEDA